MILQVNLINSFTKEEFCMEKKKMDIVDAVGIGSEIAELELLAASCRVPTPTTKVILTEEEQAELDSICLEPKI